MIGAKGPCWCAKPTPTSAAIPSDVDGLCAICGGYFAVCGRCLQPLNNGREHGLGVCSAPERPEAPTNG